MTARTKRRHSVLAAVAALAVVAVAARLHVQREADARRLAEQLAALDAADPHWRLDDLVASLRATPLAAEDNLHTALAEAAAVHGRFGGGSRTPIRNALFAELTANVRLSPSLWRFVIEGVEAHEDAIRPALEFDRFPRGRHADAYVGDGYATAYRPMDDAANLRGGLLLDLFLAAVQRGDTALALRLVRGSLYLGRSYRDEPLRPSQWWRARLRMDAVRGLERLLGHRELTDAQLAGVESDLRAELADDLMLVAARGQLAQADRIAEMARRGEMPASQFRRVCERDDDGTQPLDKVRDWLIDCVGLDTVGRHADALGRAAEVLAAVRQPWPERWRAIQALGEPDPLRLGQGLLSSLQWFARDEARVRCALAAIVVERYRLAHGDWPATLGVLGPLPGNPLTGGPLDYRRTGDGVEIYVPMPELQPSGDGWIDPAVGGLPLNRGVGFRLWDVPQRNQPAPGGGP